MTHYHWIVMNITPAASDAPCPYCGKLFYLSMTFMISLTFTIQVLQFSSRNRELEFFKALSNTAVKKKEIYRTVRYLTWHRCCQLPDTSCVWERVFCHQYKLLYCPVLYHQCSFYFLASQSQERLQHFSASGWIHCHSQGNVNLPHWGKTPSSICR